MGAGSDPMPSLRDPLEQWSRFFLSIKTEPGHQPGGPTRPDQRGRFASLPQRRLNAFLYFGRGGGRELFRGLEAVLCRQLVSWVGFLAADSYFKGLARHYYAIESHQPLPFGTLLWVATAVGVFNTG